MKKHLLYFLSTVLGFCAAAQSPVIYVKTDGTGDGTSWSNACNIEYVIGKNKQLSASAGTEIWVQQGTYYPAAMLTVPDSVKLYGGFVGTENDLSQRDVAANPTIIDAQKKFGSVIDLEPFSTLDGFTIQNGFANNNPNKNGGGVWAKGQAVVSNCLIINNFAYSNGGGIYGSGDIEIINTTIEDNAAGHNGQDIHGCCIIIKNGHTSPFICIHPSIADHVLHVYDVPGFSALTVTAVGTESLSYQWYSNAVNSHVGGTPVGTNSSSFTPPLFAAGKIYYYCIVSNDYGQDTSDVSGFYETLPAVQSFDYTGTAKEVALIPGVYEIECWGAQGGDMLVDGWTGKGGHGAYTFGTLTLTSNIQVYIYVGQAPANGPRGASAGGWNGGGWSSEYSSWGCAGGGATDIRLIGGTWDNLTSLRSRIMVAGAGGGSNDHVNGGNGGLVGSAGQGGGGGGSQTSGGSSNQFVGTFGKGGGYQRGTYDGGGGGSGYYGGGNYRGSGSAGGGGSSFISGHSGCNAVDQNGTHLGTPNHYSGLVFTKTIITAGNAYMPNPRGAGTIAGNSGHGFVRISRKK